MEFCSVNRDAWYYRSSVACDTMERHKGDVRTILIRSPVTYGSVVHSARPSQGMWRTNAPTFNKWHKEKKKKKKKVTLHMLTRGAMWGCGLTSLVVYINDKICDIRERTGTIRSEIWTTNIHSLGFHDIREHVTLWRLILQNFGCTSNPKAMNNDFRVQPSLQYTFDTWTVWWDYGVPHKLT